MARNARRHEAKLAKQRARNKTERKAKRRDDHDKEVKRKEKLRNAFGTTAYCWPSLYHSLFFDRKPNLAAGLDFTGADLHLELFETQEARRTGEGGQVVTALRIDSCKSIPKPNQQPDELKLLCTGTLTEQVSRSSIYGSWFRKQAYAKVLVGDDEEFQEVPVSFTLSLAKFNAQQLKRRNRLLDAIDQIPFTLNAWNVYNISLPETSISGCALETERLHELLFMLRIWTPILTLENFAPSEERRALQLQLERYEALERAAAEALTGFSARTELVLEAGGKEADALKRDERKVRELKQSFDAAEARRLEIEAEPESERKRLRLRSAASEARTLRDNWVCANVKFEREESERTAGINQAANLFLDAAFAEYEVANKFIRAFLHWQQAWTYLTLKQ